jgi:hypothetical protein
VVQLIVAVIVEGEEEVAISEPLLTISVTSSLSEAVGVGAALRALIHTVAAEGIQLGLAVQPVVIIQELLGEVRRVDTLRSPGRLR